MKKVMHNLSEHEGKDDHRMGIGMRKTAKKTCNLQGNIAMEEGNSFLLSSYLGPEPSLPSPQLIQLDTCLPPSPFCYSNLSP
jgi:hypothetical protein